MKKLLLSLIVITVSVFLFAQTPNEFKYQAVLRNTDGALMAEESVTIVISILKSDLTTSVFNETHNITTTSQGLINLNIGSIEDLSIVNWTLDEYFIEISVNGTIIGTSQLLSVPYALHAKTAETITGEITVTETDPTFTTWDKSTGISITESQISDLQSYLTTEIDPMFTSWDKTTGIIITEKQISDLQTYLTAETDPIFTTSQAANIAETDIANLGNLSGVNTGDQDLSALATKTELGDSTAQIRSEIPTAISNLTMDANSQNITNLADPVNNQDAATKAYVDEIFARIEALEESDVLNNGFTDSRDSNHYEAIKIGNQIWMAENLAYLPSVNWVPAGSEDAPGSYYYVYGYNDTDVNEAKATSNYATYGVLYNWTAAMAGSTNSTANPSGVQGVCPTSWHLPSDAEWTELTDYLGGTSVAGGKLKEIGIIHWISPNTGATNETSFTALPGGFRPSNADFDNIGFNGYWWSATMYDTVNAWSRIMDYFDSGVIRVVWNKDCGFSVRCVRD